MGKRLVIILVIVMITITTKSTALPSTSNGENFDVKDETEIQK